MASTVTTLICITAILLCAPNSANALSEDKASTNTIEVEVDQHFISIDLSVPAEHRQAIAAAELRGHQLWLQDQAAWHTTDHLSDKKLIKVLKKLKGKNAGYLATRLNESHLDWNVAYLGNFDGQIMSVIDVEVRFNKDKTKFHAIVRKPSRELDSHELSLLQARTTAFKYAYENKLLKCTEGLNTAAQYVDHNGDDYIVVYILAAGSNDNPYPMGGYHSILINPKDYTVESHYAQTKGCLNGQAQQEGPTKITTLMTSHITSNLPTAFHAFMSRSFNLDIFVGIDESQIWRIRKGKISLPDISDKDDKQLQMAVSALFNPEDQSSQQE